ncbi:TPA: hydroxyacid-oxoacid transhydrogenase [Escherichia coli]|nr:hydroxyacid-oxoacid transhydrogenase [Escherichia coli]
MSGLNLAAKSKEEQDKVAIDLVASGVAYKERLAMPVVAELVAREQPEHLIEYFWGRLEHYRQVSAQLPDKNAPEYAKKRMRLKDSEVPDEFYLPLFGF